MRFKGLMMGTLGLTNRSDVAWLSDFGFQHFRSGSLEVSKL